MIGEIKLSTWQLSIVGCDFNYDKTLQDLSGTWTFEKNETHSSVRNMINFAMRFVNVKLKYVSRVLQSQSNSSIVTKIEAKDDNRRYV